MCVPRQCFQVFSKMPSNLGSTMKGRAARHEDAFACIFYSCFERAVRKHAGTLL